MADLWKIWLPEPTVQETLKKGGFYAKRPFKGLKIISLNTNSACYVGSFPLYAELSNPDPDGQLEFMKSELIHSEKNNEKVYIIGVNYLKDILLFLLNIS